MIRKEPIVAVGIPARRDAQITTLENGLSEVEGVEIGSGFHWQRNLTLRYEGNILRRADNAAEPQFGLVNYIPAERYLQSVIASEMKATAPAELLKAHAVISRSWLMGRLRATRLQMAEGTPVAEPDYPLPDTCEAHILWHDHEEHTDFDVCSDDHCQRYQGVARECVPAVEHAIAATRGMVLADAGGRIVDARFSKCCGGVTELFENCWQPRHHSSLVALADTIPSTGPLADLASEAGARAWILSSPKAFCNVTDRRVLSDWLKDYDLSTTPDFYRWKVEYGAEELAALVARKLGRNLGRIRELRPLHRGPSGRITRLLISGTEGSMAVGKELEIRRVLSPTHLRSSAFVADPTPSGGFILRGAGWGHGVGLCQTGAAAMAAEGYDFRQILTHYYPGSHLQILY